MNAVGYTRVSLDDQVEHGHSLAAQETLIRQFAESRGWQLVRVYSDPGISGRSDERPGLAQLEADAVAGQFDVVIVHAIDRLYRRLERLLKVLQGLQQCGVAFVSVVENLDFTTPWGKMALAVLGTLAEIYIDRLSAETAKGKHQRAREGLWNGSIPLGYCSGKCAKCTDPNGPNYCPHHGGPDQGDGKILVPHPIEREAVRLAFEWYVTGKFSDGDIAEKLNAACHRLSDGRELPLRPKSEAGRNGPGIFTKDTLREVLVRVFYTGMVPYYGTDGKGHKRKRKDPGGALPWPTSGPGQPGAVRQGPGGAPADEHQPAAAGRHPGPPVYPVWAVALRWLWQYNAGAGWRERPSVLRLLRTAPAYHRLPAAGRAGRSGRGATPRSAAGPAGAG